MTLTEFLLARIAEDEAVARAVSRAHWRYSIGDTWDLEGVEHDVVRGLGDSEIAFTFELEATHIARHDPARVLAKCEALRRIVEQYASLAKHGDSGDARWVLPLLALPYADHPDYREEWRTDGH